MITKDRSTWVGASRLVGLSMALAVAVLAVGPIPAMAGDENPPKATQVIDDYIKATGGKAAYEKIHNSESEMKFEIPMSGMTATMTVCAAKPNKQVFSMNLGAMGRSMGGTDGKIAWTFNDMQGPMILEGEARDAYLRDATFNAELHWAKMFKTIECKGNSKVGETECYKLVMTPDKGKPKTYHFAQDSKLLLQVDETASTPMGDIQASTTFEDYKKVGDILVPHKMTQKMPMGEQVFTTESIKFNVDLPKDRFDPPDEVRKKLEQTAKKKKGKEHDHEGHEHGKEGHKHEKDGHKHEKD